MGVKFNILIFSICSSIALFSGDLGHVHFGIASYPGEQGPRLFEIPIWVFLEFFVAAFILLYSYPVKARFFKFYDPKPKAKDILFHFLATIAIYYSSSISESFYILKIVLMILILSFQFRLCRSYFSLDLFDLALVCTFGCLTEFTLGQLNIFVYQPSPSVIGTIPIWLPIIYASAGLSARVCGRYLIQDANVSNLAQ